MTEINQEERAYLAFKQNPPLRLQYKTPCGSWWDLTTAPRGAGLTFRVHPDDEEKLDAIIWEGADSGNKYAYVDEDGMLVLGGRLSLPGWKLIATRELPAENEPESTGKKECGLMQEVSYEQAQLDSECRDFIAEFDDYLNFSKETSVGHKSCLHNKAKHLLERINPKPVCKCCGQVLEKKDD